ncbi:MAG: glycosyltransferase [Bdellovibrionales bacterium]|nr:glycosyltransferase [Bdellovibrionales bacterium]
MRLLLIHNHYRERGGEDAAFLKDVAMLQRAGHEVHVATKDSRRIKGLRDTVAVAWNLPHSACSAHEITNLIGRIQPNLVHVHNLFPLWTASILPPARHGGAAVVATLHNFRLFCANGLFLRNDRPCTCCLTGGPLPGLLHGCYRNSRLSTLPMTRQIVNARRSEIWPKNVDLFLALSSFSRSLFVRGGIPEDRIRVRPNFCEDIPPLGEKRGDHFLFVGRLSREKGPAQLVRAFEGLPYLLRIVGEGPELNGLKGAAPQNVSFLGRLPEKRVAEEMSRARAVIVPSLCFENFPLVIAEAYRAGTPVLASHVGSLPELVEEGKTGALFQPDSPSSMRAAVSMWALKNGADVSLNCRKKWEREFSEHVVLKQTEALYSEAVRIRHSTP